MTEPPPGGMPGAQSAPYAPTTRWAPPTPPRRRVAGLWARIRAAVARRRLRVVGTLLVVLGLFAGGFATGWSAHTIAGVPAAPDTTVELVDAPPDDAAGKVLVPDVRGLRLADAQQAVADAGIPVEGISVVEAPSALPAGTVVAQDPIGGSPGTGTVTLTAAVAGTMPALVGSPATAAAQTLLDLGVRATQTQVYDPSVAEGTVLAVDPAPGAPLAATATLTVAGPASSVFLAELDPVESACSSGTVSIDGTDHEQSLYCSLQNRESTQVYLLDRKATRLTGILGITDQSEPGATGVVRIVGDGAVLFEGTARYGGSAPFDAAVGGVLRLEIRFTGTRDDATGQLGLGELRAVGSPEGIDELAAG